MSAGDRGIGTVATRMASLPNSAESDDRRQIDRGVEAAGRAQPSINSDTVELGGLPQLLAGDPTAAAGEHERGDVHGVNTSQAGSTLRGVGSGEPKGTPWCSILG